MAGNRDTLDALLESGGIHLQPSASLDQLPASFPTDFDFSKIEGMMLGLAVGDALGNTTEGKLPEHRHASHGEIRDYLFNHHAGREAGVCSDDSQLAFWTLEALLDDGGLDPERLGARFCRGQIFGIGSTVRRFVSNYNSGMLWSECGPRSAGNGALMRIAPVLMPHLLQPTADLWADAALAAMLTHNDPASTAACVTFIDMLWQLLGMCSPPDPSWWLETYVANASTLEGETSYQSRSPHVEHYDGPIWRFVEQEVAEAVRCGWSTLEACNRWYSAAFLMETIPGAIYILSKYGHDPEEAIVRAVNDTKDNDTIAAIVGAAVGALHGKAGLPQRWLENLTGRTAADDDGRMFELLTQARERWWHGS